MHTSTLPSLLQRLKILQRVLIVVGVVGCAPCAPSADEPAVPAPPARPSADAESRGPGEPAPLFLPLTEKSARARLWRLFVAAEQAARGFARQPAEWSEIRVVVESDRALWTVDGKIEIPMAEDPEGAMFHEVFHSAFHHSALHAGSDELWGEAFCDAFRYVMERTLLPEPSDWVKRMDVHLAAPVAAATVGDDQARQYWHPASLILRASSSSLEGLQRLWFRLLEKRQQVGGDILNEHFGYDVETGVQRVGARPSQRLRHAFIKAG